MDSMKVTILGSGTSMGVPTLACKCPVCLSTDPRDKRLRAGAWLRARGRSILIDCSVDFRMQALREGIEDVDAVLITHTHSDHVSGIDDLRIYNQIHNKKISVFSSEESLAELGRRFAYAFRPYQVGGGVPQIDLVSVDAPFEVFGLEVTPIPVKHGVLDIYGYRIGGLGYITDGSYLPESSLEILEGCDTLVINALKRVPHSTHFSLGQAVEIAERIQPRQAFFIHISHDLGHAATNASLPRNMNLAHDGLEFETWLEESAEEAGEATAS